MQASSDPCPGFGATPGQPGTLDRSDGLSWLARAGTAALTGFVIWMVASRLFLDPGSPRPPLLWVGWGVLHDSFQLRGHALGAFRLALAVLWAAVPLWTLTGGFRHRSGWVPVTCLAIGLGGLAAAVPLLAALAVLAVNALLWSVATTVGLLLVGTLLLRAVTAPFRRW